MFGIIQMTLSKQQALQKTYKSIDTFEQFDIKIMLETLNLISKCIQW